MSDAWETVLSDEALFAQTNRRGVDYARTLRGMLEADREEAEEWHLDLLLIFSWKKYEDEYRDLPGVGFGITNQRGELKVVTLCPSRSQLLDLKRQWIEDDGPPCGFGVLPRVMFDELISEADTLSTLVERCVAPTGGVKGTLH